jgi:hypothetical protein
VGLLSEVQKFIHPKREDFGGNAQHAAVLGKYSNK